ncbi:MAG: hypothetical protein AAF740_05490, partial [Bacteroidota bacterium]
MKNLFRKRHTLLAVMISLLLTFAACQEEIITPTGENEAFSSNGRVEEGKGGDVESKGLVTLKDGRLAFATRDAFEKIVGSEEFEIPTVNQFNPEAIAEDEVLAEVPERLLAVLNDDYVVEVAGWAVKLDFNKEIVYVMQAEHIEANYENLVAGKEGDLVKAISMEESVFDNL